MKEEFLGRIKCNRVFVNPSQKNLGRGFSTLEILLAITLITVSISAVLVVISESEDMIIGSESRLEAVELLKKDSVHKRSEEDSDEAGHSTITHFDSKSCVACTDEPIAARRTPPAHRARAAAASLPPISDTAR